MLTLRRFLTLGLILGLVFVGSANAIVIHNGGNDQNYINHGAQYPVVWLGAMDGANQVPRGSAVVIDPHWVLTAGHNLHHGAGGGWQPIYDSFYIGLGDNIFENPGSLFHASQHFIHENYWDIAYSPDIALLYFESPILGVTPAALFTGTDTLNSLVNIVGYGQTGTPAEGYTDYGGQKRGCQGRLNYFGMSSIPSYQALSYFYPSGDWEYLPRGGVVGPGDSGGGWFYPDGSLMGITGFHISSPNYGAASGALRVSLYTDWIYETQATVPEPATLSLLIFGGLVFLRRRQRVV